jgi:hypothetical protein
MVDLSLLSLEQEYSRPELARLWGYKDWHALGRGIITPKDENKIILFVTHHKQESLTQYHDELIDGVLYMEGEKGHANDDRLINSMSSGDEVYLFYRERHHSPFTYYGRIYLMRYEKFSDKPSRFVFNLSLYETLAADHLLV